MYQKVTAALQVAVPVHLIKGVATMSASRRGLRLTSARVAVAVCGLAAACAAIVSVPLAHGATSNLFAVVDGGGSQVAGSGVSGIQHLGTGRYEVTFAQDVSRCAYVATTKNAYSQAIQVFTAGGHNSAQGVYVETKNQGGGLTDGPFNLVVDCGRPGMRYAVVGYAGQLARGTSGTTVSNLGTGRYNVTFPSSVSSCAYLATVGDPANGIALAPNNVSTGSSAAGGHTVYVETKNPGGGLSSGIPFHLAVICPAAANAKVAVVNANGVPARGSSLTSSFNSSAGSYTVATNRNVASCAAIATRGSTTTSVPFDPATVEITAGPAANTVGVQTRSLLFFGGQPIDEAFHSALVC
jgi:hypothetical protein